MMTFGVIQRQLPNHDAVIHAVLSAAEESYEDRIILEADLRERASCTIDRFINMLVEFSTAKWTLSVINDRDELLQIYVYDVDNKDWKAK